MDFDALDKMAADLAADGPLPYYVVYQALVGTGDPDWRYKVMLAAIIAGILWYECEFGGGHWYLATDEIIIDGQDGQDRYEADMIAEAEIEFAAIYGEEVS